MDPDVPSPDPHDEAELASLRTKVADLEARLARSERLLATLLEQVPLAVQIFGPDGASRLMNERQRALLGLPDRTIGVGSYNVLHDPFQAASGLNDAYSRAYAGETVHLPIIRVDLGRAENRWPTDRRAVWLRSTFAPVPGPGGEVEAVIAFVEDITEEREALDNLARTTELWEAFFAHAPLAIQIFGRDGTSLRMNEANRRLLGLSDVTYGVGKFNALTDPFMVAQGYADLFRRAYAGEIVELPDSNADFDHPVNSWQTGRHIAHYSQILVPIRDADGAVAGVVSCAMDITARKAAEEAVQRLNAELELLVERRTAALRDLVARLEQEVAERRAIEATLRASEERYRALVEASPDLLFRIGRDGSYLDVHAPEAAALIAPAEQIVGRRQHDLLPPEVADRFIGAIQRALGSGEIQTIEYLLPLSHGERWFEGRIVRSGADEVFASIRDITERRAAEETRLQVERRLQNAQRLESLGVLAGGIAHDFNNILTALLGHAELARAEASSETVRDHLIAIGAGARRAADLTAQILAYAGRGRVQSQQVALDALVAGTRSLAAAVVGGRGDLRYSLAADAAPVVGDPRSLRQLLLNLVANAAEALGPEGGTITVETAAEELTQARLGRLIPGGSAVPGAHVRLTVRDTGVGMGPETLARIFDPFFTTKFAGRGLGLAAVHGIVRAHHGAMEVRSAPGHGTTFHVWLPVARAVEAPAAPAAPRAHAPLQQGRVIMVVDDEESVRLVVRRLLERDGYSVVAAPDGAAAIAMLEAGLAGLVVVLLDLTMPGVAGDTVAASLRTHHPEAALLLMSGYSQNDLAERQRALGAVGWLQKPFSGETLRARVRRALDEAAG